MYVIITLHTQVSNILFTDLSVGVSSANTFPFDIHPKLRVKGVARRPEGSQ